MVFRLVLSAYTHPVRHPVFVILRMGIADACMEIQRQPAVQWQRIAARDATALIVALLARFAELVVELADVVHHAEIAPFLLIYIIAHFGRYFPEGISSVFVAPRPRSPRAVYEDAHVTVDAPFDAEVGSERSPAQQVGTQGK